MNRTRRVDTTSFVDSTLEFEFLRALGLVRVLIAGVNLELPELLEAKWSAGHHSLDGPADDLPGLLGKHLFGRCDLLSPGIVGVILVFFLVPLFPGEVDFLGVHNDHEIAGVAMGCKVGLVLTAQDVRDGDGQPTDNQIRRINYDPLLLDRLGICHKRGHRSHHSISTRFKPIPVIRVQ